MKKVLTIAGSDPSGGAGIQADIKTMAANGVYAMSVITSLTAQNTTGVYGIFDVSAEFVEKQMESVFEDIFPDSVKIGMVSSCEIISVICRVLKRYKPQNIVIDPVMVSTSGSKLICDDAINSLVDNLFPMARVITPNISEAEILSGRKIENIADMEECAKFLSEKYNIDVLIKGGHGIKDANDLLWEKGEMTWFFGERINNPNTHGTGCTLSSAIASNLAKGYSLKVSIANSKDYITKALMANLNLGKGSGPLKHNFRESDF